MGFQHVRVIVTVTVWEDSCLDSGSQGVQGLCSLPRKPEIVTETIWQRYSFFFTSKTEFGGLVSWLSGSRSFLARLVTRVQSLEPTWWEERTDSGQLSSDLQMCTVAHACLPLLHGDTQ